MKILHDEYAGRWLIEKCAAKVRRSLEIRRLLTRRKVHGKSTPVQEYAGLRVRRAKSTPVANCSRADIHTARYLSAYVAHRISHCALQAKCRRIFPYKRTIRIAVCVWYSKWVLEAVRTEWSSSPSSGKPARSTSVVTADNEGLDDVRHGGFEVVGEIRRLLKIRRQKYAGKCTPVIEKYAGLSVAISWTFSNIVCL